VRARAALVEVVIRWVFVGAVYVALGVSIAIGLVECVDAELKQRVKSTREAKALARQLGLQEAVDNRVETLGVGRVQLLGH